MKRVLFKSQNVQLETAEQNEDIKFKIKRAEFDITNTGKLTLGNDVLPTRTLKQNSLRTTNALKQLEFSILTTHARTSNRVIISKCAFILTMLLQVQTLTNI